MDSLFLLLSLHQETVVGTGYTGTAAGPKNVAYGSALPSVHLGSPEAAMPFPKLGESTVFATPHPLLTRV